MPNQIPYWGSFGSGTFDYDPSTTAMGQEFLSAVRQSDPNAAFVPFEIGGEGSTGLQNWRFSGSPLIPPKAVDLNPGAYNPLYYSPVSSAGMSEAQFDQQFQHDFRAPLINPGAVWDDPRLGMVTDWRNVRPDQPGWLDFVGPAAVGAFGFGAPMLFGALSGGALGGAASSLPWYANAGLQTARQAGSGNWNPLGLASAYLPGLSMFGIPPELAQGLQFGGKAYGAYNAMNQPQQPPQTEVLAYDPTRYGKMNQQLPNNAVNPDKKPVATTYTGEFPYQYGQFGPAYGTL